MSYKVCLEGGVDDILITDEKALLYVQVANESKRKRNVCSKARDDFIGGQLK
jgi:hypothetical protein